MSTNNEPIVESVSDDLDAFSADFFGQKPVADEPASSEESKDEPKQASDAQTDDTHSGAEDTPANEETDESDPVEGEEDEPQEPGADPAESKPKKNRFQERIDELVAGKREAERRLADLEAKLAQTEPAKQAAPVVDKTFDGPTADDKNEDGTDKYPLGEFDPGYIRDLTLHTIELERAKDEDRRQQESQQLELDRQKAEIHAEWNVKLEPAKERYPDFVEKGSELLSTFESISPAYGEYLESTIMSMEFGPDVLYYLANNVDEAKKIVNSGAAKATVALGRLEAKFALAEDQKQQARPKISKAPAPPAHVNKGSSVSQSEVPDDTDDLDAFASKLFTKRGS